MTKVSLASLSTVSLVFVVGLVLALGAPTNATGAAQMNFRGEEVTLAIATDEGIGYVRIHLLLADDGSGSFDDLAAQAIADAIAGFPGAVVVGESEVSAAFRTFTSWDPPTASWSYNDAGAPDGLSGIASVLADAANSWNGVGGSPWSFVAGGSTSGSPVETCAKGANDGESVVAWVESLPGNNVAQTCTWFGTFATEFDMRFAADRNWTIGNPVQTDLRSVAVHEFGHALGLLHTQRENCPGASMCSSYINGTTINEPQPDDIDGVVSLYGGSQVPPTPTPVPTETPTPTATTQKQIFFLPAVARD